MQILLSIINIYRDQSILRGLIKKIYKRETLLIKFCTANSRSTKLAKMKPKTFFQSHNFPKRITEILVFKLYNWIVKILLKDVFLPPLTNKVN